MPESKSGALDQLGESPTVNRFAFIVLPLHHSSDQPAAGIRTRTLFFSRKIIKIAETNLMVKTNRMLF
jgi:hypothetical protein